MNERPPQRMTFSPGQAIDYLNKLDWHFYGGSYFDGRKGKYKGQVHADL